MQKYSLCTRLMGPVLGHCWLICHGELKIRCAATANEHRTSKNAWKYLRQIQDIIQYIFDVINNNLE